jgi:uncharacterized protein YraI
MKHLKLVCALAAVLAVVPAISSAQWGGYAARPLNLRAGPAAEYPLVALVPAGVPISVQGCLSGYQWCDVVAGPDRGWVYAKNIYYPYRGANVPIPNYGAMIGIGIVAFAVGSYWDDHYRGHAWYPQRQHWIDRPRPGYWPGGHRPEDNPGFGPGGHRPPDGPLGGPRGYRSRPGFGPDDHRLPQDRGGDRDHRLPQDRGGDRDHRLPQDRGGGRDHRLPQDHERGGR